MQFSKEFDHFKNVQRTTSFQEMLHVEVDYSCTFVTFETVRHQSDTNSSYESGSNRSHLFELFYVQNDTDSSKSRKVNRMLFCFKRAHYFWSAVF